MNNSLLIHIGMPKTGTTALQNFLLQNNDKLLKYGWCYPILSEDEMDTQDMSDIEACGNAYDIYQALVSENNKQELDKGMEIVLKKLKEKNVIISTEGISVDGIELFIGGIEKIKKIKVVVYLRRQDREIESMYNQLIKGGNVYDTFEKFIESEENLKKWLGYLSKLDSISQIIGKENLIVRVYESQQLVGNDIVADFMSVLGIPLDKDEWKKNLKKNFAIEGNALEIKRVVNSAFGIKSFFNKENMEVDRDTKVNFNDIFIKLSGSFKKSNDEFGFFMTDKRKEFLEKFALENEQIAREYLNREDGILFYDDKIDYSRYLVNQSTDFEADIIRIFTLMIFEQNRRTHSLLEKKSEEIIGKFLMKDISTKSKDRKLLLFGAGYKCKKLFNIVKNISITMIVDNNRMKNGTVLNGLQVRNVKDITNWQEYFIIVTCEKTEEIEEQLCSFGLKKEENYILMKEYGL